MLLLLLRQELETPEEQAKLLEAVGACLGIGVKSGLLIPEVSGEKVPEAVVHVQLAGLALLLEKETVAPRS